MGLLMSAISWRESTLDLYDDEKNDANVPITRKQPPDKITLAMARNIQLAVEKGSYPRAGWWNAQSKG